MLNVIIPYRNRKEHLDVFIKEFPKVMSNISFNITVVEQLNDKLFNRGRLLNIGFFESDDKYSYFCFHDVDMIPIEADYSYPESPIHMATNCSQFSYKLPYENYFGGVNLFNKDDFIKINGYSNEYFGWGAEDDDLLKRVLNSGFELKRRKGIYKSLPHKKSPINHSNRQNSLRKLKSNYNFREEGLNTLKYDILSTEKINDFCEIIKVDF